MKRFFVVCIKSGWSFLGRDSLIPVKGEIYTVVGAKEFPEGLFYKILELNDGNNWYHADGLRPVDDTFGHWAADKIEVLITIEEAEKEFV